MKKILLALMCLCVAVTFTACSTESSVKTETKVSVSTDNVQSLLDKGDKNIDAKKFDDAIKNYTDAIELDPNYSNAYNNRGALYFNTGEHEKGIADFKKAVELDPNNESAVKNLKKATENNS